MDENCIGMWDDQFQRQHPGTQRHRSETISFCVITVGSVMVKMALVRLTGCEKGPLVYNMVTTLTQYIGYVVM